MSIPRSAAAGPTFYAAQHSQSVHPAAPAEHLCALQVCQRAVVTAPPAMRVSEAARLMRDERVGALIVVDGRSPSRPTVVGIVTDRDITTGCIAADRDPHACTVGDIMSRDIVAARPEDAVPGLLSIMQTRHVRRLPVIGPAHELLGMLTLDDLVGNIAAQVEALGSALGTIRRRPA
jgi:CBS domain-containing protein